MYMKKIGWEHQFSSILNLTDKSTLKSRLLRVNKTDPKTIVRLVNSFISRTKKFESMTIWFMTYVLLVKRGPEGVSVELKKNYADVLLFFNKKNGQKLTMDKHSGEGIAALVSLFKDLL